MDNPVSRESTVPDRDASYVLLVTPVVGRASEIIIAADDFSERMLQAIADEHPLSSVRLLSSPNVRAETRNHVWKMA